MAANNLNQELLRRHVDDVILPNETRAKLVAALDFLRDKQVMSLPKKHGNIPL